MKKSFLLIKLAPVFIHERKTENINCTVDQHYCFLFKVSLMLKQIQTIKLLASFCDCTGLPVSDLVTNPIDRFSSDTYHLN